MPAQLPDFATRRISAILEVLADEEPDAYEEGMFDEVIEFIKNILSTTNSRMKTERPHQGWHFVTFIPK